MRKVILATNNSHKASEIKAAFQGQEWEFLTLSEADIRSDPVEDADTFEGNARIKARAAWKTAAKSYGVPCAVLADDSGLEVDALSGAPGVHSARYAGDPCDDAANNRLLLQNLDSVSDDERTARFVCTMAFIDEQGLETVARGTVEGKIGYVARGAQGFGYDPLFLPDELGGDTTFAEVPQTRKNDISHRARALRALKDKLL